MKPFTTMENYQQEIAEREVPGVTVDTDEHLFYTDESPEYSNPPGNRFEFYEFAAAQRIEKGQSMVKPRFFRETITTIVNREELTEDEWVALQSDEFQELYRSSILDER